MRLDRLITLYLMRPLLSFRESLSTAPASALTSDIRPLTSGLARSPLPAPCSLLPILMYHSISDNPEPGVHPYYRTCTSPNVFANHMAFLKQNGYQTLTISQAAELTNGTQNSVLRPLPSDLCHPTSDFSPSPLTSDLRPLSSVLCPSPLPAPGSKLVAITFDDGFQDFYTHAWPILKQYGFTATMYLPTAFIGDTRRNFSPPSTAHRPCLTWSEVRELHAVGIEFGSHTVNHPKLIDLDWTDIEFELRTSIHELRKQLGSPVTAFAHPYAFPQSNRQYTQRLVDLLQKTGYQTCATTTIGTHRPSRHLPRPLGGEGRGEGALDSSSVLRTPNSEQRNQNCELSLLKRLPANTCDDEQLFAAKLSGAYNWLGTCQSLYKQLRKN